jgi:hypothetical protein
VGGGPTLAIEQLLVLETDPGRARKLARAPLGGLSRILACSANFRRMGFSDGEIAQLDDRLVDALVVWGDLVAVTARISEHLEAGADHVALSPVTGSPATIPIREWEQLAGALATESSDAEAFNEA